MKEPKAGDRLKTLEKGLVILELLASERQGLTFSAIGGKLGMSPGVLTRLLKTLVSRGYVDFQKPTRMYHLGIKFLQFRTPALQAWLELASRARPALVELADATGARALLATYQNGLIYYLDRVDTHASLARFVPPFRNVPAHGTALGKVILAHRSPAEIEAFLANHGLPRLTDSTITDPAEFKASLAEVRARGVAFEIGESRPQQGCVAAPILDYRDEAIAAVSIADRRERVAKEGEKLAPKVRAAAAKISAVLGREATQF